MKKSQFTPAQQERLEEVFELAGMPKSLNSFPKKIRRAIEVLEEQDPELNGESFIRTASIARRWPGEKSIFVMKIAEGLEAARQRARSSGGKSRSKLARRDKFGLFAA